MQSSQVREDADEADGPAMTDPGFSIHMGITSSLDDGIFYYGLVGGRPLRMLSDNPADFERKIEMTLAIKGEIPESEFSTRLGEVTLYNGKSAQTWRAQRHKDDECILAFVEGEALGHVINGIPALNADVARWEKAQIAIAQAAARKHDIQTTTSDA